MNKALLFLRSVAGLCLIAVTLLVACDAFLRYLFSAPIYGAQDVLRALLLTMFMAALADAWLAGANFKMTLFYSQFPYPLRTVIDWLALFLSLALAVALIVGAVFAVRYNLRSGARSPLIGIPFWSLGIVVFVGAVFFLLGLFTELLDRVRGVETEADDPGASL